MGGAELEEVGGVELEEVGGVELRGLDSGAVESATSLHKVLTSFM